MNFPAHWRQLMMQCVTTVRYTLLLNGQKVQSFVPHRGLRQGDPLSPYLLLLCANVLSCMLLHSESKGDIQGIKFAHRGPSIFHLMYVDDTILFFKATDQSFGAINSLLSCYSWLAGHHINFSKSEILFSPNTSRDFKDQILNTTNVPTVNRLGKYLCVY